MIVDTEWPQSITPYKVGLPGNSVAVVMPVRDGLKFFKLAFHSLLNFTDYPYTLSIVDNQSNEWTKNYLHTTAHNHKISLCEYMEVNRPASINLALRQMFTLSGVNFGCVISQEAIMEPNWLSRMMKTMLADMQIGVLAPSSNIGSPIQTELSVVGRVSPAAWVSGGCILFRKTAFNYVNGFDEALHGGYEDRDFCNRVKNKGYTIAVDGNVHIHSFFTTQEQQLSSEYEKKTSEKTFFERYPKPYEPTLAVVKLKERTNDRPK